MAERAKYTSYANDTKWSELHKAMATLDTSRSPLFRVKTLNGKNEPRWDGEWHYHFRSDYVWKDMEWIELKSRPLETAVQLDEIVQICQTIGLEIERGPDVVRIIGYRSLK